MEEEGGYLTQHNYAVDHPLAIVCLLVLLIHVKLPHDMDHHLPTHRVHHIESARRVSH